MRTEHLSTRSAAAFVVCSLLLFSTSAWGDWTAQFGTPDATNRASGSSAIGTDDDAAPGFVRSFARQERPLPSVVLEDLSGDGVPEVVFLVQGALASLDPSTGRLLWRSLSVGADDFLGRVDVDGSGERYLVTAGGIGGGAYLVDPSAGGLTPALSELPGRSGVVGSEVSRFDLDGDGDDELVVPAGAFASAALWTVDFQGEPAAAAIASTDLSGYSNLTPARAGRFLDVSGAAVVINQGAQYQLYDVCASGTPDAVCDDGEGTLCLCDQGIFYGVHDTFSFGPGFVVDGDGDGVQEVVEVASHPRYTNAVYSLDFAAGLAGGALDPSDLRRWYRGYPASGGSPAARLATPEHGPVDLDGDGDLEIVVSFVGNTDSDVDGEGNPLDDGINLPGGVSVAVFDLATGDVLATRNDAFAYGAMDTDGDGTLELITSPTSGWQFDAGLAGYALDCTAACALVEVWDAPSLSIVRDRASLGNLGTPPGRVPATDLDGDSDLEIIGYLGDSVVAVESDGAGGVASLAARPLELDQEVVATYADGPGVLLRDLADFVLLGGDLLPVGVSMKIPTQGAEKMLAASFAIDEPATLIYGDFAFRPDDGPPLRLGVARPALAVDLNGDGAAELVGYSNPPDSGGEGFEVASLSWNPATASFETNWSWRSTELEDLDGFVATSRVNWNLGDFDDDGVDDVVFTASGVPLYRQLVLSGADGSLLHDFEPTTRPSSLGPILVADRIDASGAPGADGTLDIFVHGSSFLEWLTPGEVAPVASTTTSYFHSVSANGDLDGDGVLDNVVMPSSVTSRIEAITTLAEPTTLWAVDDVGLLPTVDQLMALAEIDDAAGLDVLFITGDAELLAYSGATGEVIDGFPVYLAGGRLFPTDDPPVAPPVPTAVLAMDADGDGAEDAVVGTEDGRLYAVDLVADDGTGPSLAWHFQVGAAVGNLAAAEMTGDDSYEVLVSTQDGLVHVVGPIGVDLEIEYPSQGECVGLGEFVVRGSARGIASVDLFGAGRLGDSGIVSTGGSWAGSVSIEGEGIHLVQAYGFASDDTFLALDTVEVLVDEDCESETPEPPTPEPSPTDPSPTDPGDMGCSDCEDGCSVSSKAAPGLLAALLMLPAMVLSRRRR